MEQNRNKSIQFETTQPIPYRVQVEETGMDLTADLTCAGEFSWKIVNEQVFQDHCPGDEAVFEELLRNDVQSALMVNLFAFSDQGVPYEKLPEQNEVLSKEVLSRLAVLWEMYGIQPESFTLTKAAISPEDEEQINKLKRLAELRDPVKHAEAIIAAQMEAVKAAGGWYCPDCGKFNDGNFCGNCGHKKPE